MYTCTQLYGANPSRTASFWRQVYLRLVTEITDATNIIFIAEVEASVHSFAGRWAICSPKTLMRLVAGCVCGGDGWWRNSVEGQGCFRPWDWRAGRRTNGEKGKVGCGLAWAGGGKGLPWYRGVVKSVHNKLTVMNKRAGYAEI